jgi:selenocysteine lyase/cysteine desulfurase
MTNRRDFILNSVMSAGAFSAFSLFQEVHAKNFDHFYKSSPNAPEYFEKEEDFWTYISQSYTVHPSVINLNNGGVSPAPKIVQDALIRYNALSNEGPSYYMWRILDQGREPLRTNLARLAGCDPEEIAINRNATEALNTVIFGVPLTSGDEVIGTKQDYPNMIQAWKQRAERDNIIYKQISFDFPLEDDETIVAAFENAVTSKTRLIHITHIINWVGQILPVAKICAMAKKYNIRTLVDGAHSFGLLDFTIPSLECDYFGTSLHKFLSAPIGSGMLWIRKENIDQIWPLLCNENPRSKDIRKFETLGTRSFAIEQAIGEAIHFHNGIGPKRKEERIRFLKNYWASKVINMPGVKIHTSLKDEFSCAICGVSIDGKTPAELEQFLFEKHKIHTVSIVWENIRCVRITPHVYTKISDLDKLVQAIEDFTKINN